MREYELTKPATADLAEINTRIASQDPQTATMTLRRIREAIEAIALFPKMGRETARTDIYQFGGTPNQPFRFTYRFTDETVTVIRIFRASREHTQF